MAKRESMDIFGLVVGHLQKLAGIDPATGQRAAALGAYGLL